MSENTGGWNLNARTTAPELDEESRRKIAAYHARERERKANHCPLPTEPNGSRYRKARGPQRPRPGNVVKNLWLQRLALMRSTPRNRQEKLLLKSMLRENELEIRQHGFTLDDCAGIQERKLKITPPTRNVATGRLVRTADDDAREMEAIRAYLNK